MSISTQNKRPIVHIGMHKALSSWLQHEVFKPAGIVSTPDVRIRDVIEQFVKIRTEPVVRNDWLLSMDKERNAGKQTGISAERLSGYPAMGLFGRRETAENIAEDLPDAQILIVIREQSSVIASYYQQYLHDGGSLGLKDFLEPKELHSVVRMPRFDPRYFGYSSLIKIYDDLFGKDSVLVLPYELFVKQPESWIAQFESSYDLSLSDCDPQKRINSGRGIPTQLAHRFINSTLIKTQLSSSGFTDTESARKVIEKYSAQLDKLSTKRVSKYIVNKRRAVISDSLGEFYVADNKLVSERISTDLTEFGYQ